MYASLITLQMSPGMRQVGENTADNFSAILKDLKGFKGVTYLGDDSAGEYDALVLWESEADADAAYEVTEPKLKESLSSYLKAPPKRRVFEVYEPKK